MSAPPPPPQGRTRTRDTSVRWRIASGGQIKTWDIGKTFSGTQSSCHNRSWYWSWSCMYDISVLSSIYLSIYLSISMLETLPPLFCRCIQVQFCRYVERFLQNPLVLLLLLSSRSGCGFFAAKICPRSFLLSLGCRWMAVANLPRPFPKPFTARYFWQFFFFLYFFEKRKERRAELLHTLLRPFFTRLRPFLIVRELQQRSPTSPKAFLQHWSYSFCGGGGTIVSAATESRRDFSSLTTWLLNISAVFFFPVHIGRKL